LVLDVVALRQDRIPSQAGYKGIDYSKMLDEWPILVSSIKGAIGFLEDESIFDSHRVPSYTAIPVIAALWAQLPTQPDQLGNARHLLRMYMWRSFLTARYEQSSTSNALQDYRGLRKVLAGEATIDTVPMLNEKSNPLPVSEALSQAEWPKGKTILGRGLLALSLKAGGVDLADGAKATVASVTSKDHPREYHHLFPVSTLEDAGVPDEQIYRAANCALITWNTNRAISNKDPLEYLTERSVNGSLGAPELRRRLRTHLIPYDQLAVGYENLSDDERRSRVRNDYDVFLSARAGVLEKAVQVACKGEVLELTRIFPDA
jgi:hypothetical protein